MNEKDSGNAAQPYVDLTKTIITQAGFAAAVSPFAVISQNLLVHFSMHPNDQYPTSIRAILTRKEGVMPAFKGATPFTARMTTASAMGYVGTGECANKLFSFIPYAAQPVFAGLLTGLAEAVVTGKAEQVELNAMTGGNITYKSIVKGATVRNSFGWGAGEYAMRLSDSAECSPAQSAAIGFGAGVIAGIASLPMQKALALTAANQEALFANLNKIIKSSPREILSGAGPRVGVLASYTTAAALANNLLNPGGVTESKGLC